MQKVSKETIIRTVVLFVALLNSVLTMLGKNPLPFSESEIYQAVSAVCSIAATIWAWWKNNSFTQPALEGDVLKDALKLQAKKAKEEKKQAEVESKNGNDNKEDEIK